LSGHKHAGVIAFSHANGFPAGTYRVLFEAWRAAGFKVIAVEKYGHDPAFPVSSNWPHLRDQLLAAVDKEASGQAVHFVGHSLGGYLSVLAACKRPGLAGSVVLLDAPLVAGWRAGTLRVLKASGLMARGSPGRVSARRRWQWPSAEAAFAHFAAKPNFAVWDAALLRDYISAGTESDPDAPVTGGVRLAFRREIETQLYNTLPHDMARLLRRHPPGCPVAYIGGTRSSEGRLAGLAFTQALVGTRWAMIEGSHLFPMEKPQAAAQAVIAQITGTGLASNDVYVRGEPDGAAPISR
jgi:pimeloyl-ACP methyl ester carboxylesterase